MKTHLLLFSLLFALPIAATEIGIERKIEPIPFSEVTITDNFWKPRLEKHGSTTLKVCIDQIENQTGRIRNFEKAARREGKHEGIYFDDSDVYKAMEGMAYSLVFYRNPIVENKLDEWIDKIAAAQLEDGYLNTYYTLTDLNKRWSDMDKHEMYCCGHLIEAAVAYYKATGKRKLLDVAIRFVDHIDATFGPGKRHWVAGHQEIELALVKLYHETGERRYVDLAHWLLEERGHGYGVGAQWDGSLKSHGVVLGPDHCQDDIPVADQSVIRGHAVRAMYYFCGMADVAALKGIRPYMQTLDRLWQNVVRKNMYITGGIGSSKTNEGFIGDYNLPNEEAYCETCASVGMVLWNARMNQLSGNGKYVDILERSLYNGTLAGMNLEGDRFFYVNPLESKGAHHRKEWYGCACCPSQLARFIPSIGSYIYGKNSQQLFVNLYISSQTKATIKGKEVQIIQESGYPWDGKIKVKVMPKKRTQFDLCLRMPHWCNAIAIGVNKKIQKNLVFKDGYAVINREWKKGDEVEIQFNLDVKVSQAPIQVVANWGKRAIRRGPLVYCLEQTDNLMYEQAFLFPQTLFTTESSASLLGGITTIRANNPDGTQFNFVPYYSWDNRQQGGMKVWVDFDEEAEIY